MKNVLAYFLRLACRYKGKLVFLSFLGGIDVGFSLLIIEISKRLIDVATKACPGNLWNLTAWLGLCFVVSVTVRDILSVYTVRLQVAVRNRLSSGLFSQVLHAEWKYIQTFHSGDIMTRMDVDIQDIARLIAVVIPRFFLTFLKLCGAFWFLYSMERTLAFVLAGLIPVVLLLSKLYFRRMRVLSRQVKESWGVVRQFFQESVRNVEIAKALRLENVLGQQLDRRQKENGQVIRTQNLFSVYSNLILSLGFASGYLITFSWGIFQLQAGAITFGMMTAFLQLVNMIQGPALDLVGFVPDFVSSYTAAERLRVFEQAGQEEAGGDCLLLRLKSVCLSDVSFSYQPDIPVLEKLNLSFEYGKTYALTGTTGCGKTTVFRLLLAFIYPQKGLVFLTDTSGGTYPASSRTRINFSYVPQGNYLFSGTIRDNLRAGKKEATDAELTTALKQAAAGFVFELPLGLDAPLKEQGEGLSGGQIQRLAIARALLCPGPVLLLDEVTSALDEDTEYEIISSLKQHVHNKIIIIISHKPEVIASCDYVYHCFSK